MAATRKKRSTRTLPKKKRARAETASLPKKKRIKSASKKKSKKRSVRVPTKRPTLKQSATKRRRPPIKKRPAKKPVKKQSVKKRGARKPRELSPSEQAVLTRAIRASNAQVKSLTESVIRILKRAGYSASSISAQLGWITRRRHTYRRGLLRRVRLVNLGADLNAYNPDDWRVLRAHVTERSRLFNRYTDVAANMGIEYQEAVDLWFSPEVIEV